MVEFIFEGSIIKDTVYYRNAALDIEFNLAKGMISPLFVFAYSSSICNVNRAYNIFFTVHDRDNYVSGTTTDQWRFPRSIEPRKMCLFKKLMAVHPIGYPYPRYFDESAQTDCHKLKLPKTEYC